MKGFELTGRVGIVAGGGKGIGRSIAETLAAEGATVVVFDLVPDSAPTGVALMLKVDVSDEEAVAAAFATVDQRFGRVDFLVNNSGIDIETVPSEEWLSGPLDKTIEVNLKGVYHYMRHAISRMRQQKNGSIVNIGSVASTVGVPTRPAYAASKHALVGLTRTAGIQFGQDYVRVNAVCPGGPRTDLLTQVMADNPSLREQITASCSMRRLAEPEEIADAVM